MELIEVLLPNIIGAYINGPLLCSPFTEIGTVQSVQSPKGDINYLQKFFLMFVGGRMPLHLQEDFCGTAFLSMEWLRSDPRKTAIGLYLDLEALNWCMENNIPKVGADWFSRISLFHGNVLQPLQSKLVNTDPPPPPLSRSLPELVFFPPANSDVIHSIFFANHGDVCA